MSEPLIKLRPYGEEAFRHPAGLLAWLYRRQAGKSYGLAITALDWMMESLCSVIFASAALRLGTENILKEAEVWRKATEAIRLLAAQSNFLLATSADDDHGALLDIDAIADLFEHQKLETKLWHSRTNYSRSMVVAPNPDTAVGWTGHVILDEVGRMPDFRELFEAMEPIVSSGQNFRVRLATTPPPDDGHYSYELLAPPPELDGNFPVNPRGNWYTSRQGILVHRVDAWDCAAAGVPLYDLQSREPLTPDEHRARSVDKLAWDRNYGIRFVKGGTSAVSVAALYHAQAAGMSEGTGIHITDALD
ncbi:MAG: hypothetical protein WCP35_07540 [Verrucomicrobiota bacterium]